MSDGIIFTDKTTDLLVKLGNDNLRKKAPFFLRGLVKPALRIAINLVSKWGDKVVPDKVDVYINSAIDKGYSKDWDAAAIDVGMALAEIIELKRVDPEHEKNLFVSVAQAIINGVGNWIDSNK